MSKYASTLNFLCSLHLEFLNALSNKDFFNKLLNTSSKQPLLLLALKIKPHRATGQTFDVIHHFYILDEF